MNEVIQDEKKGIEKKRKNKKSIKVMQLASNRKMKCFFPVLFSSRDFVNKRKSYIHRFYAFRYKIVLQYCNTHTM